MALTIDFGPNDIRAQVAKTGMAGRHFSFIDDLSREQLAELFKAAAMLEPYWRSRIPLLEGKILCTQFFQPSTRTRFSHETAMYRLGRQRDHRIEPGDQQLDRQGRIDVRFAARDQPVRRCDRAAPPGRGDPRRDRRTRQRFLADHLGRLRQRHPSDPGSAGHVYFLPGAGRRLSRT